MGFSWGLSWGDRDGAREVADGPERQSMDAAEWEWEQGASGVC